MPALTKSGLLLPNAGAARGMAGTIYLPPGSDMIPKKWTCRCPTEGGGVCGEQFDMDDVDRFTRHVLRCRERNEEAIHKASPRTRQPLLDPNSWDPEIETHMRKVGRRMRREGRMVILPRERAGFS